MWHDVGTKRLAGLTRGLLAAALVASAPGHAQESGAAGWQYLAEGYVMFPNMKGDVTLGDLPPAPVDESPSDIFSNLQMGAMFYFEAHDEHWAVSSDLLYMDLESDLTPNRVVSDGTAGVKQLGFEVAAMRRLTPWFELGLSAVYNKIDADVDMTFDTILGTSTRHLGLTQDWIDPTIVMRATFPLGAKWSATFRGNLGGFGVGSDLFWQLQADAVYRAGDHWQFAFGYRVIDFDYDSGSGARRFVYDMQNFGPVLRAGYRL